VNVDEDTIEFRNAYWYDDDDYRNGAARNRRVVVHNRGERDRGGRAPWSPSRPMSTAPPAPYYPPAPVGRLLNMPPAVLVDAAAQLFAALSPLPAAPVINAGGDAAATTANLTNLVEYQRALAAYAKRNEQIRTAGTLAKLLMS